MRQPGLLNVPNIISLSRLILAVFFIASANPHVRVALLVVAASSDYLDGWLARRYKLVTRSGALIDAIADRAFVLAAVAVLVADGLLEVGESLVLLSRDIATASAFLVTRAVPRLKKATFKARPVGKVVTVLQFALLIVVLERPSLRGVLLLLVAAASLVAIADYTVALWRSRASA